MDYDKTRLAALSGALPGRLDAALVAAGEQIAAEVRDSLPEVGPSVAGSPPAVDTGLLRDSLTAEADGPLRVRVGSSTPYAPYLEVGTATIGPRPFLGPRLTAWAALLPEFIRARGVLNE